MVSALPDVREFEINKEVEFIVMACDGFWFVGKGKGERRKEKGERRKEKGERRKEGKGKKLWRSSIVGEILIMFVLFFFLCSSGM